jgi:hypothetical protein
VNKKEKIEVIHSFQFGVVIHSFSFENGQVSGQKIDLIKRYQKRGKHSTTRVWCLLNSNLEHLTSLVPFSFVVVVVVRQNKHRLLKHLHQQMMLHQR